MLRACINFGVHKYHVSNGICQGLLCFSGIDTMKSIMALEHHLGFKYIHRNRFPGQSKDKVFVFKMSVDLPRSGVNLLNVYMWEEIWRIRDD